jgi:hypothetical protein
MTKEVVANEAVVDALRAALQKKGYSILPKRPFGAQGADIVAEKGDEKVVAEVIGYKVAGPSRRSDFAVAFWAAIGRVDQYPNAKVAIALPSQFIQGFGARLDSRRGVWKRIGTAFPELEIWFVDVTRQDYERCLWIQLADQF